VRSLLRHAGRDESIGPFDPDARFHYRSRPRLSRRRKKGQQGQALGRSRGGFTNKIHAKAKADHSGGIIAFDLTGGQVADTTRFENLLDIGPDIAPRAALGDKG